ncbi:MAG: hypothetical protein ACRBBP_02745 [Bdellovibrionales bacterium]
MSSYALAYIEKDVAKADLAGMYRSHSEDSCFQLYLAEKKFISDRFGVGLHLDIWRDPQDSLLGLGFSSDYYLFFPTEKTGVYLGADLSYNDGHSEIFDDFWLVTAQLRVGYESLVVSDVASSGIQLYFKQELFGEDSYKYDQTFGFIISFSLISRN